MVVPLIVVAVLANAGLIRDTHLGSTAGRDRAGVAAPRMAARGSHANVTPLRGRGLAWVTATALVTVTLASATVIVSPTKEQLEKAEMLGGSGPTVAITLEPARRNCTSAFRRPRCRLPMASALMPFLEYADRCLDRRDHILLPAYTPEVFVWARRPFAGGQVVVSAGTARHGMRTIAK